MKYLLSLLLGIIIILSLLHGTNTMNISKQALTIWMEVLIPSLFFPTVMLRLFMEYLPLQLNTKPIFNIYSYRYILLGFLLGYPNFAIYVEDECQKGRISPSEATRLIYCVSSCSLPFVFITISSLFQNIKIGLLLFISCLFSTMILLVITKKQPIYPYHHHKTTNTFMKLCKEHMVKVGMSLFFIGGYIIICQVIFHLLPNTVITPFLAYILEFSSGIFNLTTQTSTYQLPCVAAILGFGGFCLHLQTLSSFEKIKIRYTSYLAYRILQAILMFLFVLFTQFLF